MYCFIAHVADVGTGAQARACTRDSYITLAQEALEGGEVRSRAQSIIQTLACARSCRVGGVISICVTYFSSEQFLMAPCAIRLAVDTVYPGTSDFYLLGDVARCVVVDRWL